MKLNKTTNILVTGGSGFIGKRLVNALDGNIIILSRKKKSNFNTIVCDLEKDTIPNNLFQNIDKIYYLAGITHDTNNKLKSETYFSVNVDATLKLANLASKSGVKSFTYLSSVKAASQKTEGVYGISKRKAELGLLKISKKTNMHISIIRSSLVYGPEVKGNLKLMLSAIKIGLFPPLPETNNSRSMIHVDDLVSAILLVSNKKQTHGKILIATDGKVYTSRKIYEILCNVLGKKILRWSVPKVFFDFLSSINPNLKYKIDKLLGNEIYSSNELESLGFKAKKTLENINETDF